MIVYRFNLDLNILALSAGTEAGHGNLATTTSRRRSLPVACLGPGPTRTVTEFPDLSMAIMMLHGSCKSRNEPGLNEQLNRLK